MDVIVLSLIEHLGGEVVLRLDSVDVSLVLTCSTLCKIDSLKAKKLSAMCRAKKRRSKKARRFLSM